MKMGTGRVIGFATQPKMGGGMTPTINVTPVGPLPSGACGMRSTLCITSLTIYGR